jgi:salicylate hydroxylase
LLVIDLHREDIQTALNNYMLQRRVRTARVQMDSRLIGDYIYHPSGAAAEVRDHVMSNMTAQQWYEKLGWLYGGTGLEP